MVKVKPDLPEPTGEPSAFFARTTDCFFMKRGLLSSGIEIDYG